MITMKENICGSVNTRCLQSIASKCSVYQTNFNFFDQTKILSTSCSRHAQFPVARSLVFNRVRVARSLVFNRVRVAQSLVFNRVRVAWSLVFN